MSSLWILTEIAYEWGCRCFGKDHMGNFRIRALRFTEEAIELGQACEVPKSKMLELVNMVYDRPVGGIRQEVGGCMVTLAVLGRSLGVAIEAEMGREVRRCLSKSPEEFAKRNQNKLDLLGDL